MKHCKPLSSEQLTEAFRKAKFADTFFMLGEDERKRAFNCAAYAGRKIATRKFKDGFRATVVE